MDTNTYVNNYETIIKLICENKELKSTNNKLKSENMIIYNKYKNLKRNRLRLKNNLNKKINDLTVEDKKISEEWVDVEQETNM